MHAAVFLDRDDTLIHNGGDLGDPAAVRLIQGAAAAIGSLRGLGYKIVVISNQGGVARGKYGEPDVDAVHERINELVRATASGSSIDRFYYCPYHPQGTVEKYTREHPWRKPQPGMLLQAARDMQLDLGQCWMIGDQMRDIEAGAAAGVRTILLDAGGTLRSGAYAEESQNAVTPHFTARSLVEAVRIVAQQRKPEVAEETRADDETKKWNAAATAAAAKKRREESTRPPAADSLPAGHPPAPAGGDSARPPRQFRPWNAPLNDPDVAPSPARQEPLAPAAPPIAVKPSPDPVPFKPTVEPPAMPPAPPPVPPAPVPEPSAQASSPRPPLERVASPEARPPARPAPSAPPPDDDEPASTASMHATLRQILQELRSQRSNIREFSTMGYIAIVLQLGAALCLLAAFLLSPHDASNFFKWLSVGLFIQLAVIAVLMYDRE